MDGILTHVMKRSDGNLEGTVKVTPSSIDCGDPSHIVNPTEDWFRTRSELGAWIQLRFIGYSVKVTDYTLMTYPRDRNYLREWKLEGSNDGIMWKTIDGRRSSALSQPNSPETFRTDMLPDFYCLIRLTQKQFLQLSTIELFGSVKRRTYLIRLNH